MAGLVWNIVCVHEDVSCCEGSTHLCWIATWRCLCWTAQRPHPGPAAWTCSYCPCCQGRASLLLRPTAPRQRLQTQLAVALIVGTSSRGLRVPLNTRLPVYDLGSLLSPLLAGRVATRYKSRGLRRSQQARTCCRVDL